MNETTPPELNERQQVELDAVGVLAGAEALRTRLLAGLSMGNPSIQDDAFLIKCRVKGHQSLVEKVFERRNPSPHTRRSSKPDYQASDATDIVGLRLLTLYRDELPQMVGRFLTFVKDTQGPPFNLFVGADLMKAIDEITIYRTLAEQDPAHQAVVDEFQKTFCLTVENVPDNADPDETEADVKVVHPEDRYSSIHLVLSCTGDPPDCPIPLEVQIRTSFEDVWGEISWQLHHKIPDDLPTSLTEEARRDLFKYGQGQLDDLKAHLDLCASAADRIKSQINSALRPQTVKHLSLSVNIHKLTTFDLDPNPQTKLIDAVDLLKGFYGKHYAEGSSVEDFEKLSTALSKLEDAYSEYEQSPSDDNDHDREVRYYIQMEIARCLYWKAHLLKAGISSMNVDEAMTTSSRCIDLALKIYVDLENMPEYRDSSFLAFRIGEMYALRGDTDWALRKYEEAVTQLASETLLPDDHFMRIFIPRRLGIAYWQEGDRMKREARRRLNPQLFSRQRQDYYFKAYEVTKSVLGQTFDPKTWDWYETDTERQSTITANNLLDYAIEYLEAGGSKEKIEALGFSKDFAFQALPNIEEFEKPAYHDTVRAVARRFDEREMETRAAKRVLELLEKSWTHLYSEELIEDMRSAAEMSLRENNDNDADT